MVPGKGYSTAFLVLLTGIGVGFILWPVLGLRAVSIAVGLGILGMVGTLFVLVALESKSTKRSAPNYQSPRFPVNDGRQGSDDQKPQR